MPKTKVSFNIQGVLAPVFTPVNNTGLLNLSVIPAYMQYLAGNGVTGILVGGTTGEFATLSVEERKLASEAWLNAAKPLNMKVVAQVGGVPFPEVIEMAKFAEQHGADAIMTHLELYFKPKTTDHLVSYLEKVSEAAPSLPLLYYSFPMMTGVDVNFPEFFSKATAKIPNFKGMKADLGVAVQVTDLMKEDQRIFNSNHLLAPAVLLGHESSMATVTNMFPKLVMDIVDATKKGDVPLVRESQGRLNKLVTAIISNGTKGEFVPAMKAAMPLVTGINVGPPRQPITPLDEQQRRKLEEDLRHLGIDVKNF